MVRIRVGGDPVQSSIASFGSENEKNIVDPAGETALICKNHPAYKHRDVVKVDLQGDIALGTALQQFSMIYSTRRLTIDNSFSEVILQRKTKGKWKLVNNIMGLDAEQKIWHWNPE